MEESQRHDVEWKKPNTINDSIYIQRKIGQNYSARNQSGGYVLGGSSGKGLEEFGD